MGKATYRYSASASLRSSRRRRKRRGGSTPTPTTPTPTTRTQTQTQPQTPPRPPHRRGLGDSVPQVPQQCPGVPREAQRRYGCVRSPAARARANEALPTGASFEERVDRALRENVRGARKQCARTPARGKMACVLDAVAGVAREELDVVPTAPKEWRAKPEEWLTNVDIDRFLQYLAAHNASVHAVPFATIDFDDTRSGGSCHNRALCALDLAALPAGRTQVALAMNLGRADSDGFHWVAVYACTEDALMYYFDSARMLNGALPASVTRLHARWKQRTPALELQSNRTLHQRGNNNCGVYVAYFLALMCAPLHAPLPFPVVPPARAAAFRAGSEQTLHPTFHSAREKTSWLETHVLRDDDMQYYRDVFWA